MTKQEKYKLDKPLIFKINGVEYLNCGTDLVTNMVNIKNIKSGNYKEIDYYKLQEKLKI
tara:strand:- start:2724 stop:2900 length:177 start_codon:yes stop_codon:yes gene_type:complete